MSEERTLVDAFRKRLAESDDDWSEVEVDADQLRDLLELAECEVRRREDRTVKIRNRGQ
ncbi:MAG: hypothetical protein WC683_01355 [bacterium]